MHTNILSKLLLIYFLTSCSLENSVKEGKKNVLFVIVDDLRPELGCYGVSQIQSPNIDQLAHEGQLFERAFCQVPVCGASRASIFTGAYPTNTRFRSYHTWVDQDMPESITLFQHYKDPLEIQNLYGVHEYENIMDSLELIKWEKHISIRSK